MTTPSTAPELKHSAAFLIEEYYQQSETIIKKAKSADRALSLTETRKLKELSNAIKGLESSINYVATEEILWRLRRFIDKTNRKLADQLVPFGREFLRELGEKPWS